MRLSLLLPILMLSAACDPAHGPLMDTPDPRPIRLTVPEADFRLTERDRARVAPAFDVDALERLLGMVRPDLRSDVLKHFQIPGPGEQPRGALTEFFDPQLQEVLEIVWAPMWDGASDEALAPGTFSHFPGRGIARERRERLRREAAQTPVQPTVPPQHD